MIGDTTHDLQMAAAAGVASVGVTYGAHLHAHLAPHGALALVESVAELRTWLAANLANRHLRIHRPAQWRQRSPLRGRCRRT